MASSGSLRTIPTISPGSPRGDDRDLVRGIDHKVGVVAQPLFIMKRRRLHNAHFYVDAGPGAGLVGNTMGERGDWLKSKSDNRLPRMEASSRTSGRGSGRPSVLGSRRWLFRKSSSMNFRYASKLSI